MRTQHLRPAAQLFRLTLLLLLLLGASGCDFYWLLGDSDGDGWAACPDNWQAEGLTCDCDDLDEDTHPTPDDQCDGKDNNCNGTVDEGECGSTPTPALTPTPKPTPGATPEPTAIPDPLSVDNDGDGFREQQGDCDDSDASFYPSAPDEPGDGVDKSCDGSDGLAPSVGLTTKTFRTIQSALDAASDGQTVWVGHGTYREGGLSMKGKALRLVSTDGEASTIIDAQGVDTVFYFNSGETEESVLSGFTLTNGKARSGGGMYLDDSSPTLTNVTITENTATGSSSSYGAGGGAFMNYSSPTLTNVKITGNTATGSSSSYGYGCGGGVYMYYSDPDLKNVMITGNTAKGLSSGYGGGVFMWYSTPTLTNVTVTGNTAESGTAKTGYGGGMHLSSSSPTLTNVTITGNDIDDYNASNGYGGGMSLTDSSPTLVSCILAYNYSRNGGGNLYNKSSSTLTANRSLIYNPTSFGTDNITPSGTVITMAPQFLAYADSQTGASCTPGTSFTCQPADLHLALDSPLINAGDTSMTDADGSRADIGTYGGEGGDQWDVDGDGVPDYFWPGEWSDAPEGFDPDDYDRDDLDPTVQ